MSIHLKKTPPTSRILGIDFGRRDVGLAIADIETKMAFAHQTLLNDKNLMQNLAKIIAQEAIAAVVIGIPSHINSRTNKKHFKSEVRNNKKIGVGVNREEVEYEAERLGEILENELGVRVEYQNEMFTTKMAQAKLIEKGIKGIKRFDDQEAACIILQDWLDKKK